MAFDDSAVILGDDARAWLGRSTVARPFLVTDIHIAQFAYSIGASDPIHFDADTARAAGYPGVVAPLGYYVAIRTAATTVRAIDALDGDGAADDLTPPTRATQRLAGASNARFIRRIVAGDLVTVTKTLTEMTEKRGRSGALAFLTYSLSYTDAGGTSLVEETYARILR